MAFLKGNTYVDGDLIVNGNVKVDSLSASGVKYPQLTGEIIEDNYIALTESNGNLKQSSIKEEGSPDGSYTYSFAKSSKVESPEMTVDSNSIKLNTPIDNIEVKGSSGVLKWVYADGTKVLASSNVTGARGSNPAEYPVGVVLE